MKKYTLGNGIKVVFEKTSSKSVAVEVAFKVGSDYETDKIRGISHFLEHMLFEGTKKRKTSLEIANEIEKYGAEFNAYTGNERTAFFIKIINKRFEKALGILSDMICNSIFDKKMIKKEKQVILKEINMVTDDPKQHQWVLFQKALFDKHPAKNPAYGTVKTVKALNRKELLDYYHKHYVPGNMVISVVGNVTGVKQKISRYFSGMKSSKIFKRKPVKELRQTKVRKVVEKRRTGNSYMVLGFKTVPRACRESYVFDVIYSILGKPQSGWMHNEIRNKRGLAYQVGIMNENDYDYGFFAVFVSLDKKNISKAKNIILQQFRKLFNVSEKELDDAKNYLEGNYTLQMEDTFHLADNLAFWETIKDASLASSYLKNIRKVTLNDVKKISSRYLLGAYTLAVIEQK